jgi:hypothetical protein
VEDKRRRGLLNKKIKFEHTYRAIVTMLDEENVSDVTLMSEDALA